MLGLEFLLGLPDFFKSFKIVNHVLHLRIWLHLAVTNDLVVVVEIIDVDLKVSNNVLGNLDWKINHQSSTKITTSLHQVVCTEMVVLVRTHVVSAEGRLDCVNRRAFQLVE